jgi:exocyst complex component 6
MGDMRTWLLDVREKSRVIGEVAFHHTDRKRTEWRRLIQTNPIFSGASFNSVLERIHNEQDECISSTDTMC